MPEITIKFRHNPKTGKREMIINYESDADALPHEHEQDHRALVEQLLGRKLESDEKVLVRRLDKSGNVEVEAEAAPEAREAITQKG